MMNQNDLGRAFKRGETNHRASNVQIVERGDFTVLLGYGHAVYAARHKESGAITHFEGWRGYSVSTSCQLSKLGTRASADAVVDESPGLHDFTDYAVEGREVPA